MQLISLNVGEMYYPLHRTILDENLVDLTVSKAPAKIRPYYLFPTHLKQVSKMVGLAWLEIHASDVLAVAGLFYHQLNYQQQHYIAACNVDCI